MDDILAARKGPDGKKANLKSERALLLFYKLIAYKSQSLAGFPWHINMCTNICLNCYRADDHSRSSI